ncbi:uncharacterized protein LOC142981201 isoform X2 [Anticarsia gemmatalis]|uniref:uncharacterized protein LOC142981201 isoform X2 n=1 Tax=Anticarsia gemmatalis TaxID=129554 RepID=UPI003F75F5B5
MYKKIFLVFFAVMFVSSEGVQPNNYELSRNQLGKQIGGFGIRDLVDLLLGNNYGHRPGYYPGGGYYPGQYGPAGPPGAHPGCPLCDSSVYSYCSYKQEHDSCCCGTGFNPISCYKTDCNFLYANSCQEYQLITNCCCVDLYKNSGQIAPTDVI